MIQTVSKKEKIIGIELLRIFSMIMIVILHILNHGGVLDSLELYSPLYFAFWTIEGICYISVNCYVLISGYLLSDKAFNLKRIFILLMQVLFYSIMIYLILLIIGVIDFSPLQLLKSFFPTLFSQYWFFTIYIEMLLLSPFANKLISSISQKQHLLLIGILIFLFSIVPNIISTGVAINFGGGTSIIWFMTLYFISSYIRKYGIREYKSKKIIIVYLCSTILIPLSKFIIVLLGLTSIENYIGLETLLLYSKVFYRYNSILVLISSIAFFLLFFKIKISNNYIKRIILFLAPLTFGVYLIHDNPFMRNVLWNFLNIKSYAINSKLLLLLLPVALLIYICCSLIEWLRVRLFKKIDNSNYVDKFIKRVENFFENLINKIIRI